MNHHFPLPRSKKRKNLRTNTHKINNTATTDIPLASSIVHITIIKRFGHETKKIEPKFYLKIEI